MTQNASRRCLIIATILFVLAGALGVPLALTSFFLFDAPGSEKNPATIVLFWSALTLPVACFAWIALSWILYAKQKFAAASWISFLPAINLFCGGGALIWLEIFNGGRLS